MRHHRRRYHCKRSSLPGPRSRLPKTHLPHLHMSRRMMLYMPRHDRVSTRKFCPRVFILHGRKSLSPFATTRTPQPSHARRLWATAAHYHHRSQWMISGSSLPQLSSPTTNTRTPLQCASQDCSMDSSSTASSMPKHGAIKSESGAPAPVPQWGGYYVSQITIDGR